MSVPLALVLASGCTSSTSAPDSQPTEVAQAQHTTLGTAPSTRTTATPAASWAALEKRPLRIPHINQADRCPVTTHWASPPTARFRHIHGDRPILGRGPVFPLGPWAYPHATQTILDPSKQADERSGMKVLWAAGKYRGRLLIRGRQLDGPHRLWFQLGVPGPIVKELRRPATHAPLDMPSETVLSRPGCYAWQVDGKGFSEVITFEALVGR